MGRTTTLGCALMIAIAMTGCLASGEAAVDQGGAGEDDYSSAAEDGVGADPSCFGWADFLASSCAPEPFDPAELCQAVDELAVVSGCESQYAELYACIADHEQTWSCNPNFCGGETSAVVDCVDPYCQDHPAQCDSPFG